MTILMWQGSCHLEPGMMMYLSITNSYNNRRNWFYVVDILQLLHLRGGFTTWRTVPVTIVVLPRGVVLERWPPPRTDVLPDPPYWTTHGLPYRTQPRFIVLTQTIKNIGLFIQYDPLFLRTSSVFQIQLGLIVQFLLVSTRPPFLGFTQLLIQSPRPPFSPFSFLGSFTLR